MKATYAVLFVLCTYVIGNDGVRTRGNFRGRGPPHRGRGSRPFRGHLRGGSHHTNWPTEYGGGYYHEYDYDYNGPPDPLPPPPPQQPIFYPPLHDPYFPLPPLPGPHLPPIPPAHFFPLHQLPSASPQIVLPSLPPPPLPPPRDREERLDWGGRGRSVAGPSREREPQSRQGDGPGARIGNDTEGHVRVERPSRDGDRRAREEDQLLRLRTDPSRRDRVRELQARDAGRGRDRGGDDGSDSRLRRSSTSTQGYRDVERTTVRSRRGEGRGDRQDEGRQVRIL